MAPNLIDLLARSPREAMALDLERLEILMCRWSSSSPRAVEAPVPYSALFPAPAEQTQRAEPGGEER